MRTKLPLAWGQKTPGRTGADRAGGLRGSCSPRHAPLRHTVRAAALSNTGWPQTALWNRAMHNSYELEQHSGEGDTGHAVSFLLHPGGCGCGNSTRGGGALRSCIFLEEVQQSQWGPCPAIGVPMRPRLSCIPFRCKALCGRSQAEGAGSPSPNKPPPQGTGGELVVDSLVQSCSTLSFQTAVGDRGLKLCPINRSSADPLNPARVT